MLGILGVYDKIHIHNLLIKVKEELFMFIPVNVISPYRAVLCANNQVVPVSKDFTPETDRTRIQLMVCTQIFIKLNTDLHLCFFFLPCRLGIIQSCSVICSVLSSSLIASHDEISARECYTETGGGEDGQSADQYNEIS